VFVADAIIRGYEAERGSGLIYRSRSGSKGGTMEYSAIQWEGTVWLRRRVGGKEMKPDFTQFVSIFKDEVVGVFDYFGGFPDDVEMVSVDVY
jgi:hypothetical protein